jgi:hypothetical protein
MYVCVYGVLCVEIFRFLDYVSFHHRYGWGITERLFYYESFDLDLRKSFFIGGVYIVLSSPL